MKDARSAAALLVLGLTLGGIALAQDAKTPPAPSEAKAAATQPAEKPGADPNAPAIMSVSTRIEKVDPASRALTFQGARGHPVTVQMHRSVRHLDELAVGDSVEVRYVDAVATSLRKAAPGTRGPASPEIAARIAQTQAQSRGAPGNTGKPSRGGTAATGGTAQQPASNGGKQTASTGTQDGSGTAAAAAAPVGAQAAEASHRSGEDGRRSGRDRQRGGGAIPKLAVRGAVVAVDEKSAIVLLKDDKGVPYELKVKDPALLSAVKVGETVDAVFTQAVAISVDKAKPKS